MGECVYLLLSLGIPVRAGPALYQLGRTGRVFWVKTVPAWGLSSLHRTKVRNEPKVAEIMHSVYLSVFCLSTSHPFLPPPSGQSFIYLL